MKDNLIHNIKCLSLLLALILTSTIYLVFAGEYIISPLEHIWNYLIGFSSDNVDELIFWNLRLPRLLTCILVGGILGTVGIVYQSIFRNPLADPYILGVSSGSSIGVGICIFMGQTGILSGLLMPFYGIIAGCISLGIIFLLSKKTKTILNLLLTGLVLSTFQTAIFSLILILSGEELGNIFRWTVGNVSNTSMESVTLLMLAALLGMVIIQYYASALNILSVSDELALNVGINIYKTRNILLIVSTIITATVIGCVGILGFVGLITPHISKKLFGCSIKDNVTTSFTIGAILLAAADFGAIKIVSQLELPVGIITSLVGAPALLFITSQVDKNKEY